MKFSILIVALVLGAAAILLIGFLLPPTRVGTAGRHFAAPAELFRNTILDVDSQSRWRSAVASIERRSDQSWTEVTKEGEQISFQLMSNGQEAVSLLFKSTRGYSGRWDTTIQAAQDGGTHLSVREEATVASPIGRILSRLFFDPETFA